MNSVIAYPGTELELFRNAVKWKAYWGRILRPWVKGVVGEVGAGIAGSTPFLVNPSVKHWTFIEPDEEMAGHLAGHPPECLGAIPSDVHCGTLADLGKDTRFDTLVYIDVLEHIEDDRAEVELAFEHLAPGGVLIALSPACPSLFSDFDRSVGHFRRYTLASFLNLTQDHGTRRRAGCLDAPGTLLSLGNRLLLKQGNPTTRQIDFWDRWIIPIARLVDPCLGYRFGRSVFFAVEKT